MTSEPAVPPRAGTTAPRVETADAVRTAVLASLSETVRVKNSGPWARIALAIVRGVRSPARARARACSPASFAAPRTNRSRPASFGNDTVVGRALAHETAFGDGSIPDVLDWERAPRVIETAADIAMSLSITCSRR